MRNFKKHIPGLLITLITAGLSVLFILVLLWSRMLPAKYFLLGSAAIVLVATAAGLLVRSTAYKVQFTFGTIISVLMTFVMVLGSVYLMKTMVTLNNISSVTTVHTPVGIFVRADDPAVSVDDAKDYDFGILSALDTDNTIKTVEELTAKYAAPVKTNAYDGIAQMVDGLLNGETDAMILNLAYLDLFEEMDGYKDVESKIRQLEVITIENVVEVKKPGIFGNKDNDKNDPKEEKEEPHVFTVYIGGSDSRGALSMQARNDVNIIATVNTETKQVLLVTTPRDYFVPLSISNKVPDKLTHAGIYGPEVPVETLEMLYGTEIDYYFRINFAGVETLVDALGGITVNNKYEFMAMKKYYIPAGEVTLNGAEALAYARDRKNSGGDEARGKRQMEIISAAIDKAISPDILLRYTSILDSVEDCIDMSIPYDEIADLVRMQLKDNQDWDIVMYSVSGVGAVRQPWSMSTNAYVMLPDYETVDQAAEMMRRVRSGEIVSVSEEE
ncbi:MAG: LCP family protein [Clostridia bacterium]|nr:LCP family protein [Clostridia bacterium]